MRDVLKQCFSVTQGDAKLWENYLSQTDEVRCLYYPSACDDFRPFLFTDPECQAYTGYTPPLGYEAPNLFIFSDYLPGRRGENFYSNVLWADKNTRIEVDSLCVLTPNPTYYQYFFERSHTHFDEGLFAGKVVFFSARVHSHTFQTKSFKQVYALYFVCENSNVIEQLFMRYKIDIPFIAWKRDGTGLGGGALSHKFLYSLAHQHNTPSYFIWDVYENRDDAVITRKDIREWPATPDGFNLFKPFSLALKKQATFRWCGDDTMHLYHCWRV